MANLLLISPHAGDHLFLGSILKDSHWQLLGTDSRKQASSLFETETIPVVITEAELPDGSWKDVLSALRRAAMPPNLIVVSDFADERLWAEVLNMGGYDLIMKPLRSAEILRVLSLAAENWERIFDSAP